MKILDRWYYENLSHKKSVIPVHFECHDGLYRLETERKLSVLNKDVYYRVPLFETRNLLEMEDVKNRLIIYNQHIKDFIELTEVQNTSFESNIKITHGIWHPPYGNKSFRVELYNNDLNEDIGERWIMPSPFMTYLLLNQMTMRGASFIGEGYRGQGYGKKMYEITDKLSPWDIIPDGYCCAPGYLTSDGQKFWNARLHHKSVPQCSDKELLNELETLNSLYNGLYSRFGVNQTTALVLASHMEKPLYITKQGFIALDPYTYPYEKMEKADVNTYMKINGINMDTIQNETTKKIIEKLEKRLDFKIEI